ncbi:MAG: 3'(2'),5'-bisphosphate nucleotidase CysQ [Acidimicrobiia bacterium]
MGDHELAVDLAEEAGRLLMELRGQAAEQGLDQSQLKKEGDRSSHELLMRRLAEERPDDAVLSEEGADDEARLSAARTWIVDPLDGTREYSEGRSDWAVHVALYTSADGLVAGAVALPGLGLTLSTASPPAPPPAWDGAPRLVVSRTRPPVEAGRVAERLGCQLVEMGSAGAKAMAVVRGEADIYLHAGGQYEWDSAAPVAVALAAGLHATRIDGSPLLYNQAPPYLPDLVICPPALADAVIAAARE